MRIQWEILRRAWRNSVSYFIEGDRGATGGVASRRVALRPRDSTDANRGHEESRGGRNGAGMLLPVISIRSRALSSGPCTVLPPAGIIVKDNGISWRDSAGDDR